MFVQQDQADSVYLILSGWVKLFHETIDGGEAVVDILSAPHFFGEAALFNNHHYPFCAQMVEEGSLIEVPITLFDELLLREPAFARNLLTSMARTRRAMDCEMQHRALHDASQQIGCLLLRLCDSGVDGFQSAHLPNDRDVVAARLGMSPEIFSQALVQLTNDVGLVLHGSHVEIPDPKRLRQYVCGRRSEPSICQN